jgi:hypothetical protein
MIIRNEVFRSGVLVSAMIADLSARTLSEEQGGTITSTRTMTEEEFESFLPADTPENADIRWKLTATWPEKVARVRWKHETGGTMWQGHKVRTDRESQSLVLGAMVLGQPVRWKFADSWADMTPADMQSLVATVAQHVEACFRREEELQQDPTQDIESGWPPGWS